MAKTHFSLTLFGIPINQIRIRGTLFCSLIGDITVPPVSDARVHLVCGISNSTQGQVVTVSVGLFDIVLNIAETSTINPSNRVIEANLPAGSCQIIPPDGTITTAVNLVNISILSQGRMYLRVRGCIYPVKF
ncbi:unnamed protein product [Cochlearia groenlandica]